MDIIRLSIPIFFVLIAIELVVVWVQRKPYYRLNDSIADLACGVVSQLGGLFLKFASLGLYVAVFAHARLLPAWPEGGTWGAVAWVVSFVLIDHQYYWAHRMAHQTQLGWATHVVHHSSEEYNLTVALRQSTFQTLFTAPFYLPLALLGMPPAMLLVNYALNLLYQFWIHTRTVGRLPAWLEAWLNTPSHHRVHHGRNQQYLDRNHGGVFIVWDKLYGTFEPEDEAVVYGITTPLNSWNPVWANLHALRDLAADMRATRSLRDRLRAPFMPPGWRPADLGGPQAPKPAHPSDPKYDPAVPRAVHLYVLVQFVLLVALAFATLTMAADTAAPVPAALLLALSLYATAATANLGGLHDGRAWAPAAELGRWLGTLAVGAALAVLGFPTLGALAAAAAVLGLPWLLWLARLPVPAATQPHSQPEPQEPPLPLMTG